MQSNAKNLTVLKFPGQGLLNAQWATNLWSLCSKLYALKIIVKTRKIWTKVTWYSWFYLKHLFLLGGDLFFWCPRAEWGCFFAGGGPACIVCKTVRAVDQVPCPRIFSSFYSLKWYFIIQTDTILQFYTNKSLGIWKNEAGFPIILVIFHSSRIRSQKGLDPLDPNPQDWYIA